MRIGGFVRQSSTEWIGEVAAEIFIKGCDFKCSYCPNHLMAYQDLLDRTADMPEDVVIHFLKMARQELTGVVISGGEPTLQPDLPLFLEAIKKMGLKTRLKTNGSDPEMLKEIIALDLVDFIAMDVKSGFGPGQYDSITGIRTDHYVERIMQSIDIVRQSSVAHQFFTVVLNGIHTREMIDDIRSVIGDSEYLLQGEGAEKFSGAAAEV